jgi:xanthine dehydrogenase large subunit
MNAPQSPLNIIGEPAAVGQPLVHESACLHVAGAARYVDDLPMPEGTLMVAPVLSPVAHGRLRGIDPAQALSMPGVVRVLTHHDLPGARMIGAVLHDEPVLPEDEISYAGQVVALVVAKTVRQARAAARRVKLDIETLPAILSIDEAVKAQSWVLPPVELVRGDAAAALASASHRLQGEFWLGGQEQFYLEGQIALAIPQEAGGMLVHSSTQHPSEVQHWVAHALHVPTHAVQVECRRMGGGFGGKESQAGHVAVWAAIAAHHTGRACKMRLDRDEDFVITGKRHDYRARYSVGFDAQGNLLALDIEVASRCGFSADLSGPVNDRTMFHLDNAYFIPALRIRSLRCKTHTQSNTAFRGFGGPQGMLVIEAIMDDIARHLRLDPLVLRRRNLYGAAPRNVTHYAMTIEDNILEPIIDTLVSSSNYEARRRAIDVWNQGHHTIKRGLALAPVKFGISFTATQFNQAGALVLVYTDGSVLVNHGGTEMGQGLHTKVLQIVADTLGVPFSQVRISATDTSRVPNTSATAASSGTDLNGRAAEFAAREIRDRLIDFLVSVESGVERTKVRFSQGWVEWPGGGCEFVQLVRRAYSARVALWSNGFYATPKIHYDRQTMKGRPFYYFAYGAAVAEVAVDLRTGESRVLAVDVLHDVGRSINPAIDIGQIEGGLVQGIGWLTSEELMWRPDGRLATHAPSTYKIPTAADVPTHLRIDLWPEPNQEDNVGGSKAVGEPPFMLAMAVFLAIRDALAASRPEGGPVPLMAPATPEAVLRALGRVPLSSSPGLIGA